MTRGVSRRGFVAGAGAALAAGWFERSTRIAWAETGRPPDEDGSRLWLRYPKVVDRDLRDSYRKLLRYVVDPGSDPILGSAAGELSTALSSLLGREVPLRPRADGSGAIVVRIDEDTPGPEGFTIRRGRVRGSAAVIISGTEARGALYGAFHLLRLVQTHTEIDKINIEERPRNPLRLANHWDNLDRSVERGYAGESVFFWDELPETRDSYTTYARALASVGFNGTVINNVNANATFISTEMLPKLAGLAEVLRSWGLTMYLSLNFASPMILDDLATADPFDDGVKAWWRDKITEIYAAIPDLGGFLVKADSEGQPGPIQYGRTHADGANMIAEATQPHDGIVMWRAFVHDFNALEWSNKAYEVFTPLDGKFADNVVVQIKNGPIDFQPREPAHPLFGGLPNTNTMMELQITQEYTGQSTHLCYLIPMWKEVYDFDTHAQGSGTTVAEIVSGETYDRPLGGVAGVMNFGDDTDWTRHQLAAANTHGYGRLAWDPGLEAETIADEWTRQTFGNDKRVVSKISEILLGSWQTYINYTNPLGVSFLIDGDHFKPSPQTNRGWYQADAEGTGFDRTVATGNGFTGFYHPPVSDRFESVEDCPDELLLFIHHVPYDHRLHSGKTVIEHVYDSHFDGVAEVERMRGWWKSLRRRVDEKRWADTAERFDRHLEHAILWRDAMVGTYFAASKILDEKRSWVQVTPTATAAAHLLGGRPNELRLSVANASAGEVEVTAGLPGQPGWTIGSDTVTLPSRGDATVRIPLIPALVPESVIFSGQLTAGDLPVLTSETPVITTPDGVRCRIAMDAGPASSPVLAGYRKLAPEDAWDAERGYGWVDGVPQSRDRSVADPLLRDFINDTVPRTLRLTVPAGDHDLYLLNGDTHGSWPMTIRLDGELVVTSRALFGGEYEWLTVPVDGGADGRTVDLEFGGVSGQHWHLGAVALPDETLPASPAVITEATAPGLLITGEPNEITLRVGNTSADSPVDVTAQVIPPDGWTAPPASGMVEAAAFTDLAVSITPADLPVLTSVRIELVVDETTADARDLSVLATPPGGSLALALDAGTGDSPVVADYQRLSNQAWDAARGYGWVGAPPQSRDRGVLDGLRRDFVGDPGIRTLRIAVPEGRHEIFVLVGDATVSSAPTLIRSGGELLAQSQGLGSGAFEWLRFELDGGQTHDLELDGEGDEFWHLNALLARPI